MVEHYENVTQEAATKVESDNRKRMLSDIQRFELLESADDEDYFNPWAA